MQITLKNNLRMKDSSIGIEVIKTGRGLDASAGLLKE